MKGHFTLRTLMTAGWIFAIMLTFASCREVAVTDEPSSEEQKASLTGYAERPGPDYPLLLKPDRIRIVRNDQLYLFLPGSEIYEKLFARIEEAWERNRIYGSHLKVQLSHLDAGDEPDDLSRMVLEYDEEVPPCRPDSVWSNPEKPVNCYVFFLNWKRPWVVLCQDEDWEKSAFLPELEGGIGSIDDLLEGQEGEPYEDPKSH